MMTRAFNPVSDWKVTIKARKVGSEGVLSETRTYDVKAVFKEAAEHAAIRRANVEDDLEHVQIVNCILQR